METETSALSPTLGCPGEIEILLCSVWRGGGGGVLSAPRPLQVCECGGAPRTVHSVLLSWEMTGAAVWLDATQAAGQRRDSSLSSSLRERL